MRDRKKKIKNTFKSGFKIVQKDVLKKADLKYFKNTFKSGFKIVQKYV